MKILICYIFPRISLYSIYYLLILYHAMLMSTVIDCVLEPEISWLNCVCVCVCDQELADIIIRIKYLQI